MESVSRAHLMMALFAFGSAGLVTPPLLSALLAVACGSASVLVLLSHIAELELLCRRLSEEAPDDLLLRLWVAADPGLANGDPESYLLLSTVNRALAHRLRQKLYEALRDSLLRLLNDIRALLRLMLMLIRVLRALSRRPDRLDFVLILLASCRSYGHRGEPADHALPAFTSMSAVTGGAARSM